MISKFSNPFLTRVNLTYNLLRSQTKGLPLACRLFSSKVHSDPGPFELYDEDDPNDTRTPQFVVGKRNGFLPRQDPLVNLPKKYEAVDSLLKRMTMMQADGSQGLLAKGTFGDTLLKDLDVIDVSQENNTHLLSALFRDYTFLASAYLLEPCDLSFRKSGAYGLGRTTLPKSIAIPLVKLSEKLRCRPFMEYALSYALQNYYRIDPKGPLTYDNLMMHRMFEGSYSERGFVVTHVTMVAYTGRFVTNVTASLKAIETKNMPALIEAYSNLLTDLRDINEEMETMWLKSKPGDYNNFRTFIMGVKNQPMFPKGVIYEGISETPQFFRGESGANDSIIPTLDNLLELTDKMPTNPLTDILKDFRTYRPRGHSEFVQWVYEKAKFVGTRDFSMQDPNAALLYLNILDHIREFRHRHWLFTKNYIINTTNHPVATGGSPIVTWLPNQLGAVLDRMIDACQTIDKMEETQPLDPVRKALKNDLRRRVESQKRILDREVEEMRIRFPNQDKAQSYN